MEIEFDYKIMDENCEVIPYFSILDNYNVDYDSMINTFSFLSDGNMNTNPNSNYPQEL